jgi:DNA-directed RNA polymerase alpha subunit
MTDDEVAEVLVDTGYTRADLRRAVYLMAINELRSDNAALRARLTRAEADIERQSSPGANASIDSQCFEMSARLYNALADHNVFTLRDAACLRKSDVLLWKNVGKVTVRELEELLASVGLDLCRPFRR